MSATPLGAILVSVPACSTSDSSVGACTYIQAHSGCCGASTNPASQSLAGAVCCRGHSIAPRVERQLSTDHSPLASSSCAPARRSRARSSRRRRLPRRLVSVSESRAEPCAPFGCSAAESDPSCTSCSWSCSSCLSSGRFAAYTLSRLELSCSLARKERKLHRL